MAGKRITREIGKRLDSYGEKRIFDLYLKYRGVRGLLKNLPPEVGSMSNGPFYAWLKADPTQGRWNRWQDVKQIIAADLVEEGLDIVDGADDGSVPSARLRSDYRQWMASHYDRAAFGKSDAQVNVAIGVGGDFLSGLKAVEAKHKAKREEIAEADYTVVEEDST